MKAIQAVTGNVWREGLEDVRIRHEIFEAHGWDSWRKTRHPCFGLAGTAIVAIQRREFLPRDIIENFIATELKIIWEICALAGGR